MDNKPIGIFDSGVGGLSVAIEIAKLLPSEDIVYLADSVNCPYGAKERDEIVNLSVAITKFLLVKNCKLIVVACNTATAASIEVLRDQFNVPFVGMEPAVKPAAQQTHTGKIGILATEGTFNGRLFKETSEKYANNIGKIIQIGDGLVELVESNNYQSEDAEKLLKKYIQPMINQQVDKIVLGCTHYPFFKPLIEKITHGNIDVIDPAPAIAKRVGSILKENELASGNNCRSLNFYSTGEIDTLKLLVEDLFGKNQVVQQTTLDTN